jgi:hypothetical protein
MTRRQIGLLKDRILTGFRGVVFTTQDRRKTTYAIGSRQKRRMVTVRTLSQMTFASL